MLISCLLSRLDLFLKEGTSVIFILIPFNTLYIADMKMLALPTSFCVLRKAGMSQSRAKVQTEISSFE